MNLQDKITKRIKELDNEWLELDHKRFHSKYEHELPLIHKELNVLHRCSKELKQLLNN